MKILNRIFEKRGIGETGTKNKEIKFIPTDRSKVLVTMQKARGLDKSFNDVLSNFNKTISEEAGRFIDFAAYNSFESREIPDIRA